LQEESFFPARHRFAGFVLCCGALLTAVAGCHSSPAPDVVATVNGKDILRADLEKYYKAQLGDNPQQPTPEQANIDRLNTLHGMIDDEILQQYAAKFNLTASDEDVSAKVTDMKALHTQEEFDKLLKQRNVTLDDLKRDIRRELTKTKLLNKEIESKINVTDAEIASYYNSHKSEFNVIEPRYRIARIAVTSTPSQATNLQNNKASGDADAKKKIQALYAKLENGEDFGSVAMNYSEDKATNSSAGDMGFVYESQLRPMTEVYNAISKLKPGQFTDAIPAVDPESHRIVGYAIYQLVSKEPAGQRELSDPRVQQYIHQQLHDSRTQVLRNAYYEKLRDDAKIHNYLADQILKEGEK
jgi:peptidyl-prolyl cis-trans isomerase SurA